MTKTITITSGKGGVGKTNICANLALQLAQESYNTCLFDADLGLSNINILLGLYPEYTLENVLKGEKSIKDIIIRYTRGVDIVPGSTGVEFLADLPSDNLQHLLDASLQLTDYDFTLFDTAAGISKNVISFCMASSVVILVISPEPTSLTDGYSLLKVLSLKGFNKEVKIVVNRSNDKNMAELIYTKFHTAAKKFLRLQITYAGYIIEDECLLDSVNRQGAVVSLYPSSNASLCIRDIAKNIVENIPDDKGQDKAENVWSQYIELIEGPVKTQNDKLNNNMKNNRKTDTGFNETPQQSSDDKEPATWDMNEDMPHNMDDTKKVLIQLIEDAEENQSTDTNKKMKNQRKFDTGFNEPQQQSPDDRELTTWDLNEEMSHSMEDDKKISQESPKLNQENPEFNNVVNSINDLVETVSSISREMIEIRKSINVEDRDDIPNDLMETFSSISREMSEIRKSINIENSDDTQSEVPEKNDELNTPSFLVFDFKDYVEKRKKRLEV